ncbi:MAG: hypothetical protein DRI86_04885 [Bacteroidetes bacterium]|nr:MAG: hypothetical protein DRI86_04885 [Bacteroidota bacterium]
MKNLKLLFVLFLGIGLTFASCKKDDDEGNEDNPTPEAKTCYIVKETADDNSFHKMVYNTENLITEYNEYDKDGNLAENNKMTYSDDKVSLIETYDGTSLKSKIVYKYIADRIDSAIIYIDTLGTMKRVGFYKYTYNADKISNISVYFELFGQMLEVSKNQYIYSGDNVSEVTIYEIGGSLALELSYTETYEYDDKINPYRNIGINDIISDPAFMSKNNFTKKTVKDDSGKIDNEESYEISFEYNSDNYYTKYVRTSFDNSKTITYTVEYECK